MELPGPFWLVGCGNMAGAMLEGWRAAGVDPAQITIIRPSGRPVGEGIRVLTAFPEDEVPALVMLGVKPQKLHEVAPRLAQALDRETVLISILAGVELESLRAFFPTPKAIFRAMPNLPVRLNKGVTGLYGDDDPQALAIVAALMEKLGLVELFDKEESFQLITALGGSAPAFLYRFIDALGEAGAAQGLPRDQASRIALAAVAGAAELAARSGEEPATLVAQVASPGGSTLAGLKILDATLPQLLRATLDASLRRAQEMAADARKT